MAPSTMAALRCAAVLAASIALLGTGIAPAHAAEPTPDPTAPTSKAQPDSGSSGFPAELLAKPPAGSPAAYLADGADPGGVQRFAATESQELSAAAVGSGSISGTITHWKDGSGAGHLPTGGATAYLWDDAQGNYLWQQSAAADPATGEYALVDLPAGDYIVLFFDNAAASPLIAEFWGDAQFFDLSPVVTLADGQAVADVDEQLEPLLKHRMAGADRYATAVAVSESGFGADVPCVFISSGLDFPDALSAGPAAAHCGGPLLLVPGTWVPEVVIAEITRLSPDRIVVAGGTAAVSAGVESVLRGLAPEFARYAGTDRYDTSRKIVAGEFGTAAGAWVATGANFPDALSASAAAAAADIPVLIVPGGAPTLDAASSTALTDLGAGEIAVAGGPAAVSWGVQYGIEDLASAPWVYRIGGATRFDTASQIMDLVWSGGWAAYAFFASGTSFPDALAGAPLAGLIGAPLYVTPAECTPTAVQDQVASLDVADAFVLGYYQTELYYDGWKPFRNC